MTILTIGYFVIAMVIAPTAVSGSERGPSDPSNFVYQPDNMTIPVGEMAVFKCKIIKPIYRCRWYFLEKGLDFFNGDANPIMVKDFIPNNPGDCSIKFKRVKEEQEGQWICQAIQITPTSLIISQPALLNVITKEEAQELDKESQRETRKQEERPRFLTSADDHIQTTYKGAEVTLDCLVNNPLYTCSWVMPHGNVLHYTPYIPNSNSTSHTQHEYVMKGSLDGGNCSLTIHNVRIQDEGNWRCLASINDDDSNTLIGPMIHLHLIELSHSQENVQELTYEASDTTTLIYIIMSILLLIILVILCVFYCYCRRNATKKDEKQNILPATSVSSSNYSQKWMNKLNMTLEPPHLVDDLKKSNQVPVNYTDISHYNQYLDMNGTGSTVDGYIVMPGSGSISSSSSRTTGSSSSTLPMDRSRTLSSATTMSNVSNNSHNISFNSDRRERPLSLYSSGHLYEEIPDNRSDLQFKMELNEAANAPLYTNLTEDQEGYMIPSKVDSKSNEELHKPADQTLQQCKKAPLPDYGENPDNKTPPSYCKVGQIDQEKETMVVNPEYGINLKTKNLLLQNYDVPRGSSESLVSNTSGSKDNIPNYDVPRPTSTTATVTNNLAHAKVEVSLGGIPGTIV